MIEKRLGSHGGSAIPRLVIAGFEPKDDPSPTPAGAGRLGRGGGGGAEVIVEGVQHSPLGLAHDRMHGGVKGRKKSKKDKLREAAAAAAAAAQRRGEAEQNNMQG